jgi:hypothetical protein
MSAAQTPLAVPPDSPWVLPTSEVTDPATFRAAMLTFSDAALYPDAQVQMHIDAGSVLIGSRYGNMRQYAVHLYVAHMLSLARYAYLRAGGGSGNGAPGLTQGLLTSKSVSKVSVGYDMSSTSWDGAGPWNYTVYGQELWRLMRLFGTGGYESLAVANGFGGPGTLSSPSPSAGAVRTWARGVQVGWTG